MRLIGLPRPREMADKHWEVVTYHIERLERAADASDWSGAVGAAKNLCESVAKIVVAARHAQTEGNSYPQTIRAAHRTLGRLPGQGAAGAEPIRTMASAAQTLVAGLGQLRNSVGDGHGQAAIPAATLEHAGLAIDACVLWCRFVLTRFDQAILATVDRLIADLGNGEVFHGGVLAERLGELEMNDLPEDDIFRLGRAVAHRGIHGGTYVVFNEGVEAAVINPNDFPQAYRRGLVSGIFVDANGFVRSGERSLMFAHQLIDSLEDAEFITELSLAVEGADFSYAADLEQIIKLAPVIKAFAQSAKDGAIQRAWAKIATKFASVNGLDEGWD